jgi:hypothetical protein
MGLSLEFVGKVEGEGEEDCLLNNRRLGKLRRRKEELMERNCGGL